MKDSGEKAKRWGVMGLLVVVSFAAGFALRGVKDDRRGGSGDVDGGEAGMRRGVSVDGRVEGNGGERRKRDGAGEGGISFGARVTRTMGMKHPVDRITAWVKEIEGMTAENAADFVKAMNEADPEGRRSLEWQAVWRRWMTLDPAGCTRFIMALPVEGKTHFAIDVAMNKWVETDPGAAADFINSLEGEPLYDTALYSYIGRVGTSDLEGAIAMADRAWKGRPEEYNRSMERLHGEFLFANPGGDSKAFFEQIPSREGKKAAFGHVFYKLINRSPGEAGDWLVAQREFATERAIQRVVDGKNAEVPGSGDAWKSGNFAE